MKPLLVNIIALLFAFALVAAAAAQAPITYYACVNNDSGTIHIARARARCSPNEQLITWNQAGPKGDTGAAGPTGAQGPAGPPGPAGPSVIPIVFSPSLVVISQGTIAYLTPGLFSRSSDAAIVLGIEGTIDKMSVKNTGLGPQTTFTLMVDGVATSLSCVTTPSTGNTCTVSGEPIQITELSGVSVKADVQRNPACTPSNPWSNACQDGAVATIVFRFRVAPQ